MKKPMILGLTIALLLTSFASFADSQYPAADFQPEVIYLDKNLASSKSSSPAANEFDPQYPAANFQPTVIYADASANKAPAQATVDETDPKYPAAHFQPKVIYP